MFPVYQARRDRKTGSSVLRAAIFAVMTVPAFSTQALAQATPPPAPPPPNSPPEDARDTAGRLLFEVNRQTSYVVSTAVNNRLAPQVPVNAIAPLGYAGTVGVLADAPALLEAPQTQAATQPALWNVWVDGQASRTDWDDPVAGIEGPLATVTLGADRAIGGRGLIGLLVSGEHSDLDTNENAGTLESDAAGVGIYGGWLISDVLVADALFLWKDVDSDVTTPVSTGSYDATRWQAAANLTGYFYRDAWRFSPSAGISWSREEQDAYVDSLGFALGEETIDATTLSAGIQVGYRVETASGAAFEPWLGAGLDWEVRREDVPAGADEPSRADLRLNAGLNAQLSQAVSLVLTGEAGSLNRSGYETYRGGAQLSVRF